MTFDIIQTSYITNNKWFSPYYLIILGAAFILQVLKIFDINLPFESKTLETVASIIIILSFILILLNGALFTRIGHISFENEKIIVIKNDIRSEFSVSDINTIKITGGDRKQYTIKATPLFEEIIELSQDDLTQLKNFLTEHHIDYTHRSIMNWFKNLGFIKNR
ncbi:hypothetical protein [uncultured Dokdonia sp.]|uniref:hypothetical protein n=1 Tax=uncultured Dokdonia sp. TaxID=575653 RepID=UPI00262F16A8|nr:hypothetical protein [uncultured Dokdonia sp.]